VLKGTLSAANTAIEKAQGPRVWDFSAECSSKGSVIEIADYRTKPGLHFFVFRCRGNAYSICL